ncbi:MAG: SDR family NAD(P)-dependent oxidoreductase [Alphaproteobacteria bacterium]|nr:SDR family NAD(P)-dependent oxidoreductase [Alphaproteobacteria bacterium]MCB9929954.1 SDR family NAD(P)-dependent oxidoreductase [Alphaproteobacteria bacterium]
MQSIDGKIAWVTGAGTGIGRAGAKALAAAGAVVYLSGRRVPELEAVAATIREAGGKAEVAPLDILDADGCYALVDRIVAAHGRLDMVVNSAGLNRPIRRWRDIDQENFHIVVDVDLKGAFNVCHAALKPMRAQRDGLIINVSSMASQGRSGGVSGFAYASAKHGLNVMNESINDEHAHMGIRACALCPGEVATEILDKRPKPPSPVERARMVQEEDVGNTILFIAQMPPHVCMNEVHISPVWNRGYIGSPDFTVPRDD